MQNENRLISNVLSQCHKMVGNIDRFLDKDDRIIELFILSVQKVEVLAGRCVDKETGKANDYRGAFRALGRSTGRLLHAYKIAESLGREYRWADRRRITEVGTNPTRVQLEDSKSQVITVRDLHLDIPLRSAMMVLITEADREIKNPLQMSVVVTLGVKA